MFQPIYSGGNYKTEGGSDTTGVRQSATFADEYRGKTQLCMRACMPCQPYNHCRGWFT